MAGEIEKEGKAINHAKIVTAERTFYFTFSLGFSVCHDMSCMRCTFCVFGGGAAERSWINFTLFKRVSNAPDTFDFIINDFTDELKIFKV